MSKLSLPYELIFGSFLIVGVMILNDVTDFVPAAVDMKFCFVSRSEIPTTSILGFILGRRVLLS